MLHTLLISKTETRITGLSRYVDSLENGFSQISGVQAKVAYPAPLLVPKMATKIASQNGRDLRTFYNAYPLIFNQRIRGVYHLTSQTLATLLLVNRLKPCLVTVHDIIPLLVQLDPDLNTQHNSVDRLFYKLSLQGLRQAQGLIAISNFTRQTLVERLNIPADRIHVVYRAVDLERFYPQTQNTSIYQHFHLDPDLRYILFLGSDDPRKNLNTLIKAFARLSADFSDVRLVKGGASHFPLERQRLARLIKELGLTERVIFIENLPDEYLPGLYSAAHIFVLPSFFEGFGLPALEAMACGTPVIASQTASLPEVVGDSGLLFDPQNDAALADLLAALLNDPEFHYQMGCRGQQRAQDFNIVRQAQETLVAYQKIDPCLA